MAFEKAKTFSDRVTEKERLLIDASYAGYIERNFQKSLHIVKQGVEKYPNEKRGHYYLGFLYDLMNNYDEAIEELNKALELDPNYGYAINELAYVYSKIGDFEKAIEYFKRYASVSPGDANPFDSMGDVLYLMGKLNDAISRYSEALEIKPEFGSDIKIAYLYALKEDYNETIKWVDLYIEMVKSPGVKSEGYLMKGFYYYWLGEPDNALDNIQEASKLANSIGYSSRVSFAEWITGWIYFDKGDFDISRRHFKKYIDNSTDDPLHSVIYAYSSGLIDLAERKIDSAKSRLSEMESFIPEVDDYLKPRMKYKYDLLQGETLLVENLLENAIDVSKAASPLGRPPLTLSPLAAIRYNLLGIRDVLARAYIQNGDNDKAITEYEKLITFDPENENRRLVNPKLHYRLAKLYEEKSMTEKAITRYEKFLEIWKNADEDLPELIDAKKRLANLK
jgi:tetratricopeptide (TPR) repeat protein